MDKTPVISTIVVGLSLSSAAMAQESGQPGRDPAGAPAGPVVAECVPPQAPAQLFITKPQEPALPVCAARNLCSKSVAETYNLAILNYNRAITRSNEVSGDYVDSLNDYARDAGRYANCEIDRLNRMTVD